MKKIIFGAVAGLVVGGVAGYFYAKRKFESKVQIEEAPGLEDGDYEADANDFFNSVGWTVNEPTIEPEPIIKEPSEEVKERREQLERLQYASVAAANESPKEDEPAEEKEPSVKEHKKDIELLTREEWWEDDDDYDYEELYYFVNEGLLMPETIQGPGGPEELDIQELTGDIFDRIGFASNDDEKIFVRNNILKKCYQIHKVTDITPDEMWP